MWWKVGPNARVCRTSTSPIGSLLDELVYRWIKRAGPDGFSRRERLLIDLLNPAYRWQMGFDRPVR